MKDKQVDDPGYQARPQVPTPPVLEPEPELPSAPKRWHQRTGWRLFIVMVVLVLFAGWRAGTFDHALVNVGLNAKPCARNGFGAVFCGQELTERQEQQRQATRESEAAKTKSEEEEAKVKREGEESTRKLEEEQARSQAEAKAQRRKAEQESHALQQQANEQQTESEEQIRLEQERAERP